MGWEEEILRKRRSFAHEGDKVMMQSPTYPQFINNNRKIIISELIEKKGKYKIRYRLYR